MTGLLAYWTAWRWTDVPIEVAGHMVPGGYVHPRLNFEILLKVILRTELGAMRYNIFRNPDCFHEPEVFKPARWLKNMGDNLEASLPFGLGPRTCIGWNIAMMELRLIVSKLLWKFDWTPVTEEANFPEYLVMYRGPILMRAVEKK
jgi:hypothetical protein